MYLLIFSIKICQTLCQLTNADLPLAKLHYLQYKFRKFATFTCGYVTNTHKSGFKKVKHQLVNGTATHICVEIKKEGCYNI